MSDPEIEKACREWCQKWTSNTIHEPSERIDDLTAMVRGLVEVLAADAKRFLDAETKALPVAMQRIEALEAALEEADKLQHLTLGGRYHWQAYEAARAKART